jgi:hypothetical protein
MKPRKKDQANKATRKGEPLACFAAADCSLPQDISWNPRICEHRPDYDRPKSVLYAES